MKTDWKPRTKSFIRLIQRKTVLLPHPDGPMKAVMVRRLFFGPVSRTALNWP
jgi:hypothetical protein